LGGYLHFDLNKERSILGSKENDLGESDSTHGRSAAGLLKGVDMKKIFLLIVMLSFLGCATQNQFKKKTQYL
jgi:hypothetical protein